MRPLRELLGLVPSLYVSLEDAALPVRTGEPSDRARDPRDKPAPGRLEVMEHRHLLLRGLRWWVDATRETAAVRVETPRGPALRGALPRPVGQTPRAMCAWLLAHLDDMAPEDRAELRSNLASWADRAWKLTDPAPLEAGEFFDLPMEAYDRQVRVADAAELLGCTVRTIQRRVPAERRPGGMVRLGDAAPRCGHCDLIVGQCEHTRSESVAGAASR